MSVIDLAAARERRSPEAWDRMIAECKAEAEAAQELRIDPATLTTQERILYEAGYVAGYSDGAVDVAHLRANITYPAGGLAVIPGGAS